MMTDEPIDPRTLLPEDWYTFVVAEGVDTKQPGLYEWHIEGVGSYIGKYKSIDRPKKQYSRNVQNLLDGKPYRKSYAAFRRIHHELAEAHKSEKKITLTILENCSPEEINARELLLIKERGRLNGSRLVQAVDPSNPIKL
jgi:hypothetical protein